MKSKILWGLVSLNVILLSVFVGQWGRVKSADAQAVRRPADYLLIPGEAQGISSELVYIIDTTNNSLGAMVYDDSVHSLQTMPAIDLTQVFSVSNPPPANGRGRGMR